MLDSDEHHAHDYGRSERAACACSRCGPSVCRPFAGRSPRSCFAAVDQRHDRHAGFESAQPERELRKHEHGARDQHGR